MFGRALIGSAELARADDLLRDVVLQLLTVLLDLVLHEDERFSVVTLRAFYRGVRVGPRCLLW